jgi:hypothetical protein
VHLTFGCRKRVITGTEIVVNGARGAQLRTASGPNSQLRALASLLEPEAQGSTNADGAQSRCRGCLSVLRGACIEAGAWAEETLGRKRRLGSGYLGEDRADGYLGDNPLLGAEKPEVAPRGLKR